MLIPDQNSPLVLSEVHAERTQASSNKGLFIQFLAAQRWTYLNKLIIKHRFRAPMIIKIGFWLSASHLSEHISCQKWPHPLQNPGSTSSHPGLRGPECGIQPASIMIGYTLLCAHEIRIYFGCLNFEELKSYEIYSSPMNITLWSHWYAISTSIPWVSFKIWYIPHSIHRPLFIFHTFPYRRTTIRLFASFSDTPYDHCVCQKWLVYKNISKWKDYGRFIIGFTTVYIYICIYIYPRVIKHGLLEHLHRNCNFNSHVLDLLPRSHF